MSNMRLERYAATALPAGDVHVWPIKVVATSLLAGLPGQIFVYQAAQDGDPLGLGDRFVAVATLPQLSEIGLLPVMDGESRCPYYRRNTLEFDCRTAEEAELVWERAKIDVQSLLDNYNAARAMSLAETVELT